MDRPRSAPFPLPASLHPPEGVRVSVLVIAWGAGAGAEITACLDRILEHADLACEVLVLYDEPGEPIALGAESYAERDPRVRAVRNTRGSGPAAAIRSGFDHAAADVVVVTMADGCDDPAQIGPLTRLVERGVVVAAASRYMRGGQQVGGPYLKGLLSRAAGLSLRWLARVGTHDATNSFKAYSRPFVLAVGIESTAGFEVGLELVAKARRCRLPVAELPTIWLDRQLGVARRDLPSSLTQYLRWYRYAFGPATPYPPRN
ncbi:MAG: glycosyltransferase family 2 protein [Acidimicrobiales bacterium]